MPDAPESHDAQGLAEQGLPEQLIERPAVPLARADEALAFAEAAGGGEHQREGELRGGLGQNVGRVRRHDVSRGERAEVEVVHADRTVRDDLELGRALEDARVDPIEQQAHERVGVGEVHTIDADVPRCGDIDGRPGQRGGHESGQIDR